MAHSPQAHYPPPSYPPYLSPNSPTINHPPPDPFHPAKKQRLSQPHISPQSSPQLTNGTLPNPNFYANQTTAGGLHINGTSRQGSPPSAQSPGVGTMGPPNKPAAEKPVDINDLGDVMASSGVDLKDEEAALLNRPVRPQTTSFESNFSSSYNSVLSTSRPGYFDHYSYGHNTLSPNIPGDRASFYGAGSFNQQPVTPEELEEQALQAEKRAIRRHNEIRQYHLNDPFLQSRVLHEKLSGRCAKLDIKLERPRPVGPSSQQPSIGPMKVNITGPDGHPKLAVLKGRNLIAPPGNLTDIITLLSLSCKDRVRSLLEDSSHFAKGRKTTSMGVVPPELADIAVGKGKAEETTIKVASPASSLKRSFTETNGNSLPTPDSETQSVKTIAFSNRNGKLLADLFSADQKLEEERRKQLKARMPDNDNIRPGSIAATPGPSTPGSLVDKVAADADSSAPKKPLTKKELKRQESSRASEAQQHASMNTAASLALGGRGGPSWLKNSSKSWLSSKGSTNTSFAPAPRKDVALGSSKSATAAAEKAAAAPVKAARRFGDFREDAVGGPDLDLRDVIGALEMDEKEKRALYRAWAKLNGVKDY